MATDNVSVAAGLALDATPFCETVPDPELEAEPNEACAPTLLRSFPPPGVTPPQAVRAALCAAATAAGTNAGAETGSTLFRIPAAAHVRKWKV